MERYNVRLQSSRNSVMFLMLFVKPVFLQILERQNKHQRNKNKDEKREESEPEEMGGLFDD